MAQGPLFVAVLLSCVAQLYAVHTCDETISSGVLAQTQASQSYVTQFSGMQAWLVSASPDAEFGATDTYYLNFTESCGNTVTIYISQKFLDGSSYDHTHVLIKEENTHYYFEPGYDLYLNFFVCDADLVVGYKCMKEASGKTLFLVLGPHGKTADQMDVASCKAKISAIYAEAEFQDMNYPSLEAASTETVSTGLLPTVVKSVVKLVDSLF